MDCLEEETLEGTRLIAGDPRLPWIVWETPTLLECREGRFPRPN